MHILLKKTTLYFLTLCLSVFLGGESVLAQTAQSITSPTPGTTLTSSTVTFVGGHSSSEFGHSLWIGTTFGSNNISAGAFNTHTRTVSGLPNSGTIYVRYYTRIGPDPSNINDWTSTEQTYTMNVGGGTPLTINPTTATVTGGGQQTFTGAGGTPPYTFSLVANTSSGANVNSSTGQYTAGSTSGASTVRVTDNVGGTANATVTVTVNAPLTITPTSATVASGAQQTFAGAGGTPPYTFSLVANTSSGANVNASTGQYTAGSTAGTSTVRVSDNAGGTANATVTVQTTTNPLVITSPSPGSTLTTSTVTFTGGHTSADMNHALWIGTTFGSNNLSSGAIPTHTKTVSGLPSSGTIYVRYYTLVGSNSGNSDDWTSTEQTYTMNVGGGTPLTINPTTATVTGGGQQTFTGAGGTPPYTFSLVANTSSGANVNSSTGQYTAGSTSGASTVRVTDNVGGTANATVTVTVNAPLTITPTSATVASGAQQTFAGAGGTPPYTFSLVANTSSGANVNASTGQYTAGSTAGTSTVRVSDNAGGTANATVTVQTTTNPLVITSPSPGSTLTTSTVTFTGGHTSADMNHALWIGTTFGSNNLSSGAIPTHTKTVSGLPSSGTIYVRYYTLVGSDSGNSDDWTSTEQTYTMNVGGGTPLTINPTTATVTGGGQQTFTGAGGTPPYTFSLVANTSSGANVNSSTGQYTAGSTSGASTVRVTDNVGGTANATVTVTVNAPLTITPTSATVASGAQQTFAGAGGTPPYTFSLVANTSSGANVNASTGQYTAGSTAGTSTVRVSDNAGGTANATVTVQITSSPFSITSPIPGSTLTTNTVTFVGGHTSSEFGHSLWVGTVFGGNNLSSGAFNTHTRTVSGLPNSGTIYVRYYTRIGPDPSNINDWTSTEQTYTMNVGGSGSNLTINPSAAAVANGGQQTFTGANGVPPYSYSLVADTTGGATVNASTGLYRAGSAAGKSTVRVTDSNLDTVDAGITVRTAASVLNQSPWSVQSFSSQLSSARGAARAIDGDPNTNWTTSHNSSVSPPHNLQINLGSVQELEGFTFLPRLPTQGIMPSFYEFYVSEDGQNWGDPVAAGEFSKFFGEKAVSFPRVAGRYVRLRPLGEHNGRNFIILAELTVVGAAFSGNFAPNGTITTPTSNVTIPAGSSLSFSGTFSDSNGDSASGYLWDFGDPTIVDSTQANPGSVVFPNPGTYTVTYTVTDSFGLADPYPDTVTVKVGASTTLPRTNWSIKYVNSEEVTQANRVAENVLDGNTSTIWQTQFSAVGRPHEIQIDLGSAFRLDAFRYLPPSGNGRILEYHIYVSADGAEWGAPVAIGSFSNSSAEQRVAFPPKTGQFVRLVALTTVNNNPTAAMAEINLEGQCATPFVALTEPLTQEVQAGPGLRVTASVCLVQPLHAGWGVRLSVGGQQQTIPLPSTGQITPTTFQRTFTGVSGDNLQVSAVIVNAGGNPVGGADTSDTVTQVGIGDVYAGIGDSTTVGVGDDNDTDATSQDGRNTNTGRGFIPSLNNILTAKLGRPHDILNYGYSGESSAGALVRTPKVVRERPRNTAFLVALGINDAFSGMVPSGQGSSNPGPGTFKANLQALIDLLHDPSQGRRVYLAKVMFNTSSFTLADLTAYNLAIDELVASNGLTVVPPDLFTHFQANQQELTGDGIHATGTGYKSISTLWCEAITGGACPAP